MSYPIKPENQKDIQIDGVDIAILRTLNYFGIFKYPLNSNEVFCYSSFNLERLELDVRLLHLVNLGYLRHFQGFYLLPHLNLEDIKTRMENEKAYQELRPKVIAYSRFISLFPFVRAVAVSGSYSKGVFGEGHDLDFFIVASKGRLWTCRTLIRGFKKYLLPKSKVKYFCLNYFIEESNLEIPDRNLFVATEIKTLLPVVNSELISKFKSANIWADEYYPNFIESRDPIFVKNESRRLAGAVEYVLGNKLGDILEEFLFNFMLKRRKRLFSNMSQEDFEVNMRTEKKAEKHHPNGTQKKVLEKLDELMMAYQ